MELQVTSLENCCSVPGPVSLVMLNNSLSVSPPTSRSMPSISSENLLLLISVIIESDCSILGTTTETGGTWRIFSRLPGKISPRHATSGLQSQQESANDQRITTPTTRCESCRSDARHTLTTIRRRGIPPAGEVRVVAMQLMASLAGGAWTAWGYLVGLAVCLASGGSPRQPTLP